MTEVLIGLGIGLAVALVVFIAMYASNKRDKEISRTESEKLRKMLSDRMDLESSGLSKLKEENETLRKENENLRITVSTLSQKPGRKEVERLQVYQQAIDRLVVVSPGFGAAWQSALAEAESNHKLIYNGTIGFVKRLIPGRVDTKAIEEQK
ncbi:MAG: hypothetical protein PHI83_01330 [Sphaerochaetaceae bacterium]|jgi:hypothetical protein|nr:hypothetical protein [Sphaerochaetaceae bacterium]